MHFFEFSTTLLVLASFAAPAVAFEPIISIGGQHRIIRPHGESDEVLATAEQTDGKYGVITLSDVAAGGGPGPAIVNANADEMWYVLEGTYEFHVGDKVFEGGPGTFILAPAGQPHGFITKSAGRILAVYTPGGFEQFFMDWEAQGLSPGPELGKLEEKYGVTRP